MIIDKLIEFALSIFNSLVLLFPLADQSTITQLQNFSDQFRGYLLSASIFFPVHTLILLIGAIISIELAYSAFKTIKWIASILSVGIVK